VHPGAVVAVANFSTSIQRGSFRAILLNFGGFEEKRIESRECGAPELLLCFVHCWNAGS
jgi:hypothetical protein